MPSRCWLSRGVAALAWMCVAVGMAGASGPTYVITNDDVSMFLTGVTFFSVGSGGVLTLTQQVPTGGFGIAGGYFGESKIAVLNNGSAQCVYASEAASGDIVGINVDTLQVGGSASGSSADTGVTNGIGLVMNTQYLYASFSDTNTIGTFTVQPGCSLIFVSDVSVSGLQAGILTSMAIHGNMLIATYGDGSMESFNISSGVPISNGDKQNSTAYTNAQGATYPNGIDITQDGHFAIFGDTTTSDSVEVSDISAGVLKPTVVYSLGTPISSSNLRLSPDETLLYVVNTQGDALTAAFFNSTTGAVTKGCTSGRLKGYVASWSYLASLSTQTNTGNGGMVYVAEFGSASSIAMIQVSSTVGTCTLTEASTSPVADPNSSGLLSIGSFPPRSF
jgi:6-phosphogluconolactonase (cycloisomerase 2 family)